MSKLVRLLLKIALIGCAGPLFAQTTQIYSGTIKDLSGNPITSGQVTFTLTLPVQSTIPGVGTFVPTTIPCNINNDGTLSGFVNGAVSGACIVTANISLTPTGTSYRICEQPNYSTPGSCFYDYALGGTKDISSIVPNLQTGPLNYGNQPGPPGCVVGSTCTASLTPQSVNGILDATQFAGSDIGAKVNAAIATGCGIVQIPKGSYTFSTPIIVPQCVTLRGHNDATKLFWTGSGAAIIASNVSAPGQYVQGVVEGFTINGTNTTGQIGLYQGGNPACTGGCASNPSTNIGYNYTIRDVTIYNMDNGIVWGNGAFNISWFNVISNGNLSYGWYYPSTSTGGGQNSHFYHSEFSNDLLGGFFVQQLPEVTFSMHGMDIEYNGTGNGNPSGPSAGAMMIGGNYTCFDCHIEQFYGPLVEVSGNDGAANFVGGVFVIQGATVSEPYLINLDAGTATASLNGTFLELHHTVTSLVTQTTGGSNHPTVSVQNFDLVDSGFFLKTITTLTGQGVSWCLPYDNSSGTGPGFCYDGNTYLNPVGTISNAFNPANLHGSGTFLLWNTTAQGDSTYVNSFLGASNTNIAHRFLVNNSGTFVDVGDILRDGTWAPNKGLLLPNTSNILIRYQKLTATLSPTAVSANTTSTQSVTVTGIQPGDNILAFSKTAFQTGLILAGATVTGANTVSLQFANITASPITPTASEVYTFVVTQ